VKRIFTVFNHNLFLVFEPFSTTEMNLFPDVTTEGIEFPEFTTASPVATTAFPDFPELVTTPEPTPFPEAPATTPFQPELTTAAEEPELTTREVNMEEYFTCTDGFVKVVRKAFVSNSRAPPCSF